MTDETESIIADYVGDRLTITGFVDTQATANGIATCLLQLTTTDIEGKQYEIGHTWIQYADTLKSFTKGERLRMSVKVRQYKKYADCDNPRSSYSWKIGFQYPTQIVVIRSAEEQPPDNSEQKETARETPVEPFSPVRLIMEVRRLAELSGGMDELRQLIDVLDI